MTEPNAPTFLMLCHADPELYGRLVGRLSNVGHIVAHVDAKADIESFRNDSVILTEKRVDIRWAGYTMIEATLELIRTALRHYPESSHYVLVSGADYPIQSDEHIRDFFRNNPGHNFIKFYDIRTPPYAFRDHIELYRYCDFFGGRNIKTLNGMLRKIARLATELFVSIFARKQWPEDIIPCAGSQWWVLTPECCRYILEKIETEPFWTRYWKTVFCPDEKFFHTLVANSPFLESSDGFNKGYFQDENANLHIIDRSLKKIFTMDDYEEVVNSSKLFVRKVSSEQSGELLDALDKLNQST